MGQYYRTLLIFENDLMECANAHHYDNGVKLMEHSWVGNDFVNAVLGAIENNPARVAWVGDYAMDGLPDDWCTGAGFITSRKQFRDYYDRLWDNKIKSLPKTTKLFDLNMESKDCYIVNKTKQTYIDLEKYIAENSRQRFGSAWVINPLPLLTAIGNGNGGGDFYGLPGKDDVGTWAFDKIYVSDLRPSKLTEVMYRFDETQEEYFPF